MTAIIAIVLVKFCEMKVAHAMLKNTPIAADPIVLVLPITFKSAMNVLIKFMKSM